MYFKQFINTGRRVFNCQSPPTVALVCSCCCCCCFCSYRRQKFCRCFCAPFLTCLHALSTVCPVRYAFAFHSVPFRPILPSLPPSSPLHTLRCLFACSLIANSLQFNNFTLSRTPARARVAPAPSSLLSIPLPL